MADRTPFKDLFSRRPADYARYRPTYPPEVFAWLAAQAPARELAVDIGTGNGQAAVALAPHFRRVIGVDPSAAQLAHARQHERVEYRQAPAETTGLDPHSADLVTVAQALHWFRFEPFFGEVRRVVRPGGIFAAWCYALSTITPEIDAVVWELYHDYFDPYWEPERRLVVSGYADVAVPFEEIAAPAFDMQLEWSLPDLVGYLGTWSPLKRYIEERGTNPIEELAPKLERAWGDADTRVVRWPFLLRAFRV